MFSQNMFYLRSLKTCNYGTATFRNKKPPILSLECLASLDSNVDPTLINPLPLMEIITRILIFRP